MTEDTLSSEENYLRLSSTGKEGSSETQSSGGVLCLELIQRDYTTLRTGE